MEQKYKGDDIRFLLKSETKAGVPISLQSTYEEIVIYAYTNKKRIVKLSTITKANYFKLVYLDEFTLEVMIPSVETKLLDPGVMVYEFNFIKDLTQVNLADSKFNVIKQQANMYQLLDCVIKDES